MIAQASELPAEAGGTHGQGALGRSPSCGRGRGASSPSIPATFSFARPKPATGAGIMFSATRTGKLQGAAIVSAAFGMVLHAIPASATVSPTNLDFGDVDFGAQSPPQSVSITAPKGASFKSIFGLQQFLVSAGG